MTKLTKKYIHLYHVHIPVLISQCQIKTDECNTYSFWYISNEMQHYTVYFWKTSLHVSGGIYTHHQEHTQLSLQYLVLVKPLLLPAAIVEELELV